MNTLRVPAGWRNPLGWIVWCADGGRLLPDGRWVRSGQYPIYGPGKRDPIAAAVQRFRSHR